MDKVGWITVLLVLLLSVNAYAVGVRDIEIDDHIEYNRNFDITITFKGDVQNTVGRFYVDGYEFLGKQNLGALDDDKEIKVNWDREDWNNFPESCGNYDMWVEIWTATESELLDNETAVVEMGLVPEVQFIPENPQAKEPVKVILMYDGKRLSDVETEIYNYKEMDTLPKKKTDSGGMFTFVPENTGKYRFTFTDKDYCGEYIFYIKEEMIVDGPYPENPVVGENVHMAVKPGVGVILINEADEVIAKPPTTIEGGVNFTFVEEGTYTILIGNSSTRYWSLNKSITVSDRPTPTLSIDNEKPVVGDMLTLTIDARGPLDNALVTVTRPDGVSKDYVTDSNGRVVYDSTVNTGSYSVRVTKDRYQELSDTFNVYHRFSAVTTPAKPTLSDNITLTVHDEAGHAVENALVEIPQASIRAYTDENGLLRLDLRDPIDHTLTLTKTGFWDESISIKPLGLLEVIMDTETFEVQSPFKVDVIDDQGNPVNSEIRLVNPQGIATPYTGSSVNLNSQQSGKHIIRIEKTGYAQVEKEIMINAHPVSILAFMDANKLVVNITSKGIAISGIPVSAKMGEWVGSGNTGANGLLVFEVPGEGEVEVSINDETNVHEDKVAIFSIGKDRNYWLLIIPALLIGFFTVVVIGVIQYTRFYRKKKGGGRSSRPKSSDKLTSKPKETGLGRRKGRLSKL